MAAIDVQAVDVTWSNRFTLINILNHVGIIINTRLRIRKYQLRQGLVRTVNVRGALMTLSRKCIH
jgi:hypothetical protein